MTTFCIEVDETDTTTAHVVESGGKTKGRVVLFTGHRDITRTVETAVRHAYVAGRRDEAAVRAAALVGLSSGSPLMGRDH